MAQSAEYTPSHPSLVWPRSDGTSSSWPGRNTPDHAAQNGKYYEPVPDRDSRYLAFEERAGEHLAAVLGLPKRPSGKPHRIPMPSGYKIFVTRHKGNTSKRESSYCYGSSQEKRFKNVNEWKLHAEWLFDTTKSLEKHAWEPGMPPRQPIAAARPPIMAPPPVHGMDIADDVSDCSTASTDPSVCGGPAYEPRHQFAYPPPRPVAPDPKKEEDPSPKEEVKPRELISKTSVPAPKPRAPPLVIPRAELPQVPKAARAPSRAVVPVPMPKGTYTRPILPEAAAPDRPPSRSAAPTLRVAAPSRAAPPPRAAAPSRAAANPSIPAPTFSGHLRRQIAQSSLPPDAHRPAKRQRGSSESDEEVEPMYSKDTGPSGVVYDRGYDLKYQRRHRRGELVWVQIDPITPSAPPSRRCALSDRSLLPEITHWPVIIADIRLKVTVARDGANEPGEVTHSWTYHLRPLGMFSPKSEIVRDQSDLLPWAMGTELLAGPAGWQQLAQEGTRVLDEASHQSALDWEEGLGRRIRFEEMDEGEDATFRLGVAIRTGTQIANNWCQTDRIDIMSEVDRRLVINEETYAYQGLWLGGERIWVDDIVRLKKSRADVPFPLSAAEQAGSEKRPVFMRIRWIKVEQVAGKPRCVIRGDIAELALKDGEEEAWPQDGAFKLAASYKAPMGYRFKQLNDAATEAMCDVSDIAGRLYVDLLDHDTQTWLFSTGADETGRHQPGKTALALIGRLPGTHAYSAPGIWKDHLSAMIETACHDTEKAVKEHYEQRVSARPRPKNPLPTPPTSADGASSSSRQSPAKSLSANVAPSPARRQVSAVAASPSRPRVRPPSAEVIVIEDSPEPEADDADWENWA